MSNSLLVDLAAWKNDNPDKWHDEVPTLDFNREIVVPGASRYRPDGAITIRTDDNFYTVAELPYRFVDLTIETIVPAIWPEHADSATYRPDTDWENSVEVYEGIVTKIEDGVAWGTMEEGAPISTFDIPVDVDKHAVGDLVRWTYDARETNGCDTFVMMIGRDHASLYWINYDENGGAAIEQYSSLTRDECEAIAAIPHWPLD